MHGRKKICKNFKNLETSGIPAYQNIVPANRCKDCVYFSSRNCAMDAADELEPPLDLFL
ncbi:MAG: hypothetical protein LBS21_02150 [Clostridiales bacterium]|jgi:hypothetical protein|nr:hypothetical protein [Clostridiales bacterium]